jgi:hypothetical protein
MFKLFEFLKSIFILNEISMNWDAWEAVTSEPKFTISLYNTWFDFLRKKF